MSPPVPDFGGTITMASCQHNYQPSQPYGWCCVWCGERAAAAGMAMVPAQARMSATPAAQVCRCGDGVQADSRGYCMHCGYAVRGKGPAITETRLTTAPGFINLKPGERLTMVASRGAWTVAQSTRDLPAIVNQYEDDLRYLRDELRRADRRVEDAVAMQHAAVTDKLESLARWCTERNGAAAFEEFCDANATVIADRAEMGGHCSEWRCRCGGTFTKNYGEECDACGAKSIAEITRVARIMWERPEYAKERARCEAKAARMNARRGT